MPIKIARSKAVDTEDNCFLSPADKFSTEFFEKSSATKEVATLRRGILNNFDTTLKIDIETPAEANATEPVETIKRICQ